MDDIDIEAQKRFPCNCEHGNRPRHFHDCQSQYVDWAAEWVREVIAAERASLACGHAAADTVDGTCRACEQQRKAVEAERAECIKDAKMYVLDDDGDVDLTGDPMAQRQNQIANAIVRMIEQRAIRARGAASLSVVTGQDADKLESPDRGGEA